MFLYITLFYLANYLKNELKEFTQRNLKTVYTYINLTIANYLKIVISCQILLWFYDYNTYSTTHFNEWNANPWRRKILY